MLICLDIETTGVNPCSSEALQISIIDGEGTCLFNEYIKPKYATSWEGAERVNGISPAMVADKPTIDFYKTTLEKIINNASGIIGYNCKHFDLHLLGHLGIEINPAIPVYDLMHPFAIIFGEWNDYHGDYKWQKLITCASYYGYGSFGAHDALEDVKATLHCFYQMQKLNRATLKEHGFPIWEGADL